MRESNEQKKNDQTGAMRLKYVSENILEYAACQLAATDWKTDVTHIQKENTATWVDQRYGSLLARLSREALDASADDVRGSLKAKKRQTNRIEDFRTYAGWLTETPLKKVGYGVSKPGTRVWMLSRVKDKNFAGIFICGSDFDRHGRPSGANCDCRALITDHAMGRLFERLRTNALGEVIQVGLVPLTALPLPEGLGIEGTIRIPGVGRFEAVSGLYEPGPDEAIWIIKTFIDE